MHPAGRRRLAPRRRRPIAGVASLGRHAGAARAAASGSSCRPASWSSCATTRPFRGCTTLPMLGYYAVSSRRASVDWSCGPRRGGVGGPGGRSDSIVVPNWNGAAHLGPCIRSLAAQDYDDFEIVVVDNGSTDDSIDVLDALAAEIAPIPLTVLRNDVNLGFAGGVNRGIRHAIECGCHRHRPVQQRRRRRRRMAVGADGRARRRADVAIATGRLLMRDGARSTARVTSTRCGDWRSRGTGTSPAEPRRESGDVFAASGGASLFRTALVRRHRSVRRAVLRLLRRRRRELPCPAGRPPRVLTARTPSPITTKGRRVARWPGSRRRSSFATCRCCS